MALSIAIAGSLLCGCRQKPLCCESVVPCECACQSALAWLSPVTIVPVCNDERQNTLMTPFCHELATALRDRGAKDVEVRGICKRGCPPDACEPPLVGAADPLGPISYVIYVVMPDFRPYRPMRMTVDLRVLDARNDREVARVVEVYDGPQESPLRETPRQFRLFREIEREERADKESYTAFLSNSPRFFLTDSARRVTSRLAFAAPFPETIVVEPPSPPLDGPEMLQEAAENPGVVTPPQVVP
ncbi:MAG: hypothetical protein KF861_21160 [Planctomycetaceae bacterium]|nr:hypothetical protein [Planctomycetaceae bacterium]